MNESLFQANPIPESPSPKVKWMRRHGVVTQRIQPWIKASEWPLECPETGNDVMPWIASITGKTKFAQGMTEDDAITALAKAHGLRLWNEEGQA